MSLYACTTDTHKHYYTCAFWSAEKRLNARKTHFTKSPTYTVNMHTHTHIDTASPSLPYTHIIRKHTPQRISAHPIAECVGGFSGGGGVCRGLVRNKCINLDQSDVIVCVCMCVRAFVHVSGSSTRAPHSSLLFSISTHPHTHSGQLKTHFKIFQHTHTRTTSINLWMLGRWHQQHPSSNTNSTKTPDAEQHLLLNLLSVISHAWTRG